MSQTITIKSTVCIPPMAVAGLRLRVDMVAAAASCWVAALLQVTGSFKLVSKTTAFKRTE